MDKLQKYECQCSTCLTTLLIRPCPKEIEKGYAKCFEQTLGRVYELIDIVLPHVDLACKEPRLYAAMNELRDTLSRRRNHQNEN